MVFLLLYRKKTKPYTVMKKSIFVFALLAVSAASWGQHAVRKPLNFPAVDGYQVVKADFHLHTVFSDGAVWPTERIAEAYHEGLDAVAITDHLEIQRHKADVATSNNLNRSYELASPAAARMGILNIKGTEITRGVPPGHANAVFIQDAAPLFNPAANERPSDPKGFDTAARLAKAQGGFVFYNHPFHNLADDKVAMPAQVADLIRTGDIEGIEVVNGDRFSREGYRWALEHDLTLIANSDAHSSMPLSMNQHDIDHRAMTLIMAKERTEASVLEALRARRTLIWWRDKVVGRPELLTAFVKACCPLAGYTFEGTQLSFRVENRSPIKFIMEPISTDHFFIAHPMVLTPGSETAVNVGVNEKAGKTVAVRFRVVNAWVDYDQPLYIDYTFSR